MMKRFLVVLFAMALSGCLTYDSYGYRDDGYYEDRYDNGGRYYADSPYSAGRGYSRFDYPDYVLWPDYYSVLWPIYRGYHDPFHSPGFFYGVTWYPHSYFGLHRSWYSWPYYHPYAPYRYSYADGYYDHWDRRRAHNGRGNHDFNHDGQPPMYGSARNEAERLAFQSGLSRQSRLAGTQPGMPYDTSRRNLRGRDEVRTQLPDRGTMRGRAPMQQDSGDRMRAMPPSRTAPEQRGVPSRARQFDRGTVPGRDQRTSGWISDAPQAGLPTGSVNGARVRSAPYYRDVAGSRVPMTPPQSEQRELPSMSRADRPSQQQNMRQRPTQDFPSIERQRATEYRGTAGDPRMPSIERNAMPTRQFEQRAAPRHEAAPVRQQMQMPARSPDPGFARPQRSESSAPSRSSAREEVRSQSRDEN